jgi:hypothetical protein
VAAETDGRGDQCGKGRNIGVGRRAGPGHDQRGELVATEPGDRIVVGVTGQPAGDGDQDVVAGCVPVAVVDVFEVVEIQQDDDGRTTGRVGEQGSTAVEEGPSVGQVGERVVAGGVALHPQLVTELAQLRVGVAGAQVAGPPQGSTRQTERAEGEGERIQHLDHPESISVNRQWYPVVS